MSSHLTKGLLENTEGLELGSVCPLGWNLLLKISGMLLQAR